MRVISKAVAVMATAALTAGGLAATTTSASGAQPSGERASAKRFNFIASAYGTRVYNKNNSLVDSGRTAWALISCTSKTGKTKKDRLVEAELPGDQLKIGAITTKAKSRKVKRGVRATAVTRVGDIELKAGPGLSLNIEGLRGTSKSTYRGGKYSQKGAVDLLGINAKVGGVKLPIPFNPNDISPGQELRIPGLAKLSFLDTNGKANKNMARNSSVALEIKVLAAGPLKGQTVRVGSSHTKLQQIAKHGTLRGYGQAARADLLNKVVKSGRIGHQPMPCAGTNGRWKRSSLAGVNVPGVVRVGAASGQANGRLKPGKAPLARTRARIANVKLGPSLQIGAVKSWARVAKHGKKYRKGSGVEIVGVKANGRNWTKAINRAIKQQKSIRIPGIAKITPNVVRKHRKSIKVTALKITLLKVAKPLRSNIYLATSKARIK
ncbi:MAG: hypothetical protein L0K86_06150 [Actinomycetia bacterium]|nr:hypothetical protein [Actinomycetes bacterium]